MRAVAAGFDACSAPKAAPLSLRRNFSWTLLGTAIYAGCQWAMLMVMAKLGSPTMVGQYALGLAVTAPIIMLSNLQLRGVLATDVMEEHPFSTYLLLRVITTTLALLTVGGIAILAGYQRDTAMAVLAVGLTKAVESISDIAYGFLQHHERMDRIALSMIMRGMFAVAGLGVCIWLTGNVAFGCLVVTLGWTLILLTYDLRPAGMERSRERTVRESRDFWRLAWTAAPLGVVMMLSSLNTNIPRYFIQHHGGERSLGFFAAAAYTLVAGTTIVGALGQSASPRLAHYYAERQVERFRALMAKLILLGAMLGVLGVAVAVVYGGSILSVLFRSEYGAYANVLAWMMGAAAFSYLASFFGYGLTAARCFAVQVPLFAVVSMAVGVASFLLVPRFGLLGAAWATMAGAIVQLAVSCPAMLRALTERSGTKTS